MGKYPSTAYSAGVPQVKNEGRLSRHANGDPRFQHYILPPFFRYNRTTDAHLIRAFPKLDTTRRLGFPSPRDTLHFGFPHVRYNPQDEHDPQGRHDRPVANMRRRTTLFRFSFVALGLLLSGCEYGTEYCVQEHVSGVAGSAIDTTPPPPFRCEVIRPAADVPATTPMPAPPASPPAGEPIRRGEPVPAVRPTAYSEDGLAPTQMQLAQRATAKQSPAPAQPPAQPLAIPSAIPGSEAPPLRLPPAREGIAPAERQAEIRQLYAELGLAEPSIDLQGEPGQSPLTLEQLQQMAMCRSPLIRQAAADVEAARGGMIQAGAYPNPHVGYQADDINTGRTGGYQGGNFSQTIVTGGKRRLARSAASMDVKNAELALCRARFDLATQVRSNYFATLVALKRMQVNRALVEFAQGIYRVQITRVTAGQAAPYEPLQLRVLAVQAETQLVQSSHEYEAAWRRLAATLNCPEMPPSPLAGQIDGPVPQLCYEAARERILQCHTDLVTTQNDVCKARYQLQLARITPVVPNIDTTTVIEHDFTTPPFGTVVSLQVGVPIPVFDGNRGNIMAAEAALVRASSEYEAARNNLLANLADTFARYKTSDTSFQYYRGSILADQVRAYRGVYERYQVDPDADFNDVVTSQQTLATTVSTYLQLLGDRWQAVVDLAGLMQSDDLFQIGSMEPVEPPTAPMPN